jgi:hypothetical protein
MEPAGDGEATRRYGGHTFCTGNPESLSSSGMMCLTHNTVGCGMRVCTRHLEQRERSSEVGCATAWGLTPGGEAGGWCPFHVPTRYNCYESIKTDPTQRSPTSLVSWVCFVCRDLCAVKRGLGSGAPSLWVLKKMEAAILAAVNNSSTGAVW